MNKKFDYSFFWFLFPCNLTLYPVSNNIMRVILGKKDWCDPYGPEPNIGLKQFLKETCYISAISQDIFSIFKLFHITIEEWYKNILLKKQMHK